MSFAADPETTQSKYVYVRNYVTGLHEEPSSRHYQAFTFVQTILTFNTILIIYVYYAKRTLSR